MSMVDYQDADGHLIISVLKNKEGKCIAACFQPDAFVGLIKAFDGEVHVEKVKFYIEGDGSLMASLANQLQGGGMSMPARVAPQYYPNAQMYPPVGGQQLPLSRTLAPADGDEEDDDDLDDEDEDDEEDDEDASTT